MINVHGGDIYNNKNKIDFSANINPLGLPRGVKMALMESIDKVIHYPDVGCDRLREKLALTYGIEKDYFFCGNGAADIIFAITIALKPRKTIIMTPTFAEYEQALKAIGSRILYYQLKEEQGFQLSEEILKFLTSDIDMIFVCNPNNPTGEVIPKDLLLKMIEKCHENNIVIVVDECFNSFLENSKDISVIEEVNNYNNLIVINAFTKLYAMPGIRLGFGVISNRRIHEFIDRSTQPWNVSVLAQEAGIAALEQAEYVTKSMELIVEERRYLIRELEKLDCSIYGSKANYVFFKSGNGLLKKCLDHNILIRDCSNFRGLEEGYYRIAVRTHEENKKLIEVLQL